MEIAIVIGLLLIVIVLFATEKFSVDMITIGLLITLTGIGILTPEEAFRGFGSDFIIMLASIFVVGAAMQKAGVLDMISNSIGSMNRKRIQWMPTYIMSAVGLTSAFLNNTAVTAMFVAPVTALAGKMKTSPSKLLLPMAYASIIGGTCTVIGTSTNIAVNAFLSKHGYTPFGMFDFVAIGVVMLLVGILYLALFGNKLLPGRSHVTMVGELESSHFFTEIIVMPNSVMGGQKVRDTLLSEKGFKVLNIIRDRQNAVANGYSVIEQGDVLLVEGSIKELLKIKSTIGVEIFSEYISESDLNTDEIRLAEVMVTPSNDFVGQSVRESQFKRRFGLLIVAVNREGHTLSDKIGNLVIRTGDRLLVQGPAVNIEYRQNRGDITIVNEYHFNKPRNVRNALLSAGFFLGAVAVGSLEWLPLSIAFMAAAFLCIAFRCLKAEEAYQKIEWKLLILIGGMSSFGIAMEKTGTAALLSETVIAVTGSYGPLAVMGAFCLLTILLTQPLSNAAASLVVLPVALKAAHMLEVNPLSFALAVMLSASVSLITPFEPSCLLVYGPGKYKFTDFLRTGIPLSILLMVVILLMVPRLFPF